MSSHPGSRKRPCRICRKWFRPNPRLGVRQKTCGTPECKRQWHARKCAEWNRKHRSYFQANYLSTKLEDTARAQESGKDFPACRDPDSRTQFPRLPRGVVKEVIGGQHLVITEYTARLLYRSVKEVIRSQPSVITEESRQVPPYGSLRSDSPARSP